ncbi:EthD family reductase [Aquibium carbonis]|uniref:EthD family reductase n=1 Tax=Aquibium carbonis TaxID=2495581 RepID=A0A3R9Y6W7_9HYPH|nr:EthD family reductase [Aquibium carbonis]RST84515.1 EthD family reductase [Aquibium carbonis]
MARMIAMYKKPADAAAFDAHYFGTHVPIAKKIPGLRSYEVNDGGVATPGGSSDFHLIAILTFDSIADIQAGLGSPEGQAAAADLANFAQAGVDLLFFDTKEV